MSKKNNRSGDHQERNKTDWKNTAKLAAIAAVRQDRESNTPTNLVAIIRESFSNNVQRQRKALIPIDLALQGSYCRMVAPSDHLMLVEYIAAYHSEERVLRVAQGQMRYFISKNTRLVIVETHNINEKSLKHIDKKLAFSGSIICFHNGAVSGKNAFANARVV